MAENKFNLTQTGQQVQSILNASKNTDQVLAEIQEAMADLPDGQAVSAQVALNTAAIEELSEKVGHSDGAYDISEANAVGGVLATYADLAAALGENGTNIPADLRKGGMSVKFVQSSANKYVQYRLMTNTFNTTVANWERYTDVTTSNQPFSDLDISDEQGNVLTMFSKGHIKTKNFDSSEDATELKRGLMSANDKAKLNTIEQGAEVNDIEVNDIETSNQSLSDLEISDDNGNTLVCFQNGHVKTKNFDSSKDTPTSSRNTESNTDLDLSDNNGNVLVRFSGGHVKTKNFDSSKKKYSDKPISGFDNFLVKVNVGIENNYSSSNNLQDSRNIQLDRGIICFPENYSAEGEPIRLIIASFGSQGRIQYNTTKAYWTMPLVDTMLAEGYAVMQVNGTPGHTDGIPTFGGMGTPTFLQSVQKAYEYVTKKYNIKKDGVLLSGWSQGTLKTWQIAANKVLPVKAATLFGPAIDLWKLQYAYAPQNIREWMCQQFGFVEKEANKYVLDIFSNIYNSGDIVTKPTTYSAEKTLPNDYEFAYILNNYENWLGYDPICWGTSKDIIGEQFRYRSWVDTPNPNEDLCFQDVCNFVPCPMKMFVGTTDVYTTPKIVNWYKTMADNAGMLCHVRIYEGKGHDYPTGYTEIQVQTKYGGTITTNVPSWEGMLFLERYDY